MGSVEDALSVREAVLLVLDAAGGEIEGRTAAQKLGYFSGVALGQDLGHRPHYYGPYSRPFEAALNNSAFAGDIEETVRLFSTGRAFHYKLTPQGADAVAQLKQDHPEGAKRVNDIVTRLGELVPGYWQHPLSLAAKVDLIVQEQSSAVGASDIPSLAKNLGWDLSDTDVDKAVDILVGLDRVVRN